MYYAKISIEIWIEMFTEMCVMWKDFYLSII